MVSGKNGETEQKSTCAEGSKQVKESFEWLRCDARGSAYISHSKLSDRAACAFDFGEDGFAAACNEGGKLLHISARSEEHGMVFARGNFEQSLYSTLARSQRSFGGESTFGLEFPGGQSPLYHEAKTCQQATHLFDAPSHRAALEEGSSLFLGDMIENGSFNYRWPFHEYALLLSPGDMANQIGTCVFLSFIMHGTLYQVAHLEIGRRSDLGSHSCLFPTDSQVILGIGGSVRFQTFEPMTQMRANPERFGHAEEPRKDPKVLSISPIDPPGVPDASSVVLDVRLCRIEADGTPEYLLLERAFEHHAEVPQKQTGRYYAAAKLSSTRAPAGNIRTGEPKVTFVAAFRLRDDDRIDSWPTIPTSAEIYDHLGIDSTELIATGAMWETIFTRREEWTGSASELSEINLIPRCLEKILHVDLVPAPFRDPISKMYDSANSMQNTHNETLDTPLDTPPEELAPDFVDMDIKRDMDRALKKALGETPLAVVSNIFLQPNIDLKALFWKVRFLVKVYKFLSCFLFSKLRDRSSHPSRSRKSHASATRKASGNCCIECRDHEFEFAAKDETSMQYAAYYHREVIRNRIERIADYLIKSLIEPGTQSPMMPDNFVPFEPNYYYVMITLWYLKVNCSEFTWKWTQRTHEWKQNGRLFDLLPVETATFPQEEKERVALLKWYHYGSVHELCHVKMIPTSWNMPSLHNITYRLKRDALRIANAKLSSHRPYMAEDEIIDRLGFLAEPLGLDDPEHTIGTLALVTVRRIEDRDFTREINPAFLSGVNARSPSGPWEIHALCHHSRLMVANYQYKREDGRSRDEKLNEVEKYRRKFCDFLTDESSLVPCWERTSLATRRGWLRSEATSVLAATLLEICQKDFDIYHEADWGKLNQEKVRTDSVPKDSAHLVSRGFNPTYRATTFRGASEEHRGTVDRVSVDRYIKQQLEALQQVRSNTPPEIDWSKYRPPRRYHPESFFNSLDDTPQLYKDNEVDKITIPISLHLHLFTTEGTSPSGLLPRFGTHSVKKAIKVDPLSIIDLKGANSDSKIQKMATWCNQHNIELAGPVNLFRGDEAPGQYFQGPRLEDGALSRSDQEEDDAEQERVVRKLCDSLVDQEVQHRIMAVKRCSDDLLKHFVYVFHPESADVFNDYILKLPHFWSQKRGTWAVGITLRSWCLSSSAQAPGAASHKDASEDAPIQLLGRLMKLLKRFNYKVDQAESQAKGAAGHEDASEDAPIRLLPHLMRSLKRFNPKAHHHEIQAPSIAELKVSSVILSTNEFGDFSKCTIISQFMSDLTLKQLATQTPELWQTFAHQPQTGRCLIFFLILGHLCQKIEKRYKEAMNWFVNIINLDNCFVREENDLLRGEDSVGKLELGLWSLESLYKLRNTLANSLESIEGSRTELMTQIQLGPGKRSEKLERMCQESLESFERSLGLLKALYTKLDRKAELGSRYRDSLSAILSLNDSKNSLDQNTTIQKLTYLTIGYLPVGLSAAIFAIPDEQHVIIPAMGLRWFVLCIVIMFVITFSLAIVMGDILRLLNKIPFPKKKRFRPFLPDDSGGGDDSDAVQMPRASKSSINEDVQSLNGVSPFRSSTRSSLTKILPTSSASKKPRSSDIEAGNSLPLR